MLERFDAALLAAEYARLSELVSPQFRMVNPLAQQLDKEQWLAWLAAKIRYHRIERRQQVCRQFAGATIVSTEVSTLMSVVDLADGMPTMHHTYRTEVWSTHGAPRLELVHLTRMDPPA
jgi:hypothetical protein